MASDKVVINNAWGVVDVRRDGAFVVLQDSVTYVEGRPESTMISDWLWVKPRPTRDEATLCFMVQMKDMMPRVAGALTRADEAFKNGGGEYTLADVVEVAIGMASIQ